MKKVALHNLGCKVNSYETESMRHMLEQNGYEIVPFAEGADIYIINTCTVTNIADRKSRQMLHKAKKMNPDAIVVAAGCYVQASKEDLKADECIDIIIGNNRKKDLIAVLREYEDNHDKSEAWVDIDAESEYENLEIENTADHVRAYIKVQDGCNQFCSYCIIPYTRGRVRSRKAEDVVAEVHSLAVRGYKEVVLTGIHLSSYGVDHGEGENLLTLIQAVHEVEGIERIRLGSLEPRIVTEEFAKALSSLRKMCPHFHLSLQSGCDATLKRMNRRYDSAEYYEKCQVLRKYFENPAITTDVIVGFPGETDEEFQTTRNFLEKIDFYETHVFKYSVRKGTRAAAMENQVDDRIKTERSSILLEMTKRNSRRYREAFLGRDLEILVEDTVEINGKKYQSGHTKEYVKAAFSGEEDCMNQIVKGKATGFLSEDMLLLEK